jgi:hypothetical protein
LGTHCTYTAPGTEAANESSLPSAAGTHSLACLAVRSGIKQGVTIPAFENVHIYPFHVEVLNLNIPSDIDGRPGWLKQLITE